MKTKRIAKISAIIFLAVFAVACVFGVACGKSKKEESPEVKSVSLTETSVDMKVDDTYNLVASVTMTSGSYSGSYSWTSSNPDIVNFLSSSGSTATIKAYNPGSVTITVSVDGGHTATCSVKVSEKEETTTEPTVTKVTLDKSTLSLEVGATTGNTLTATVAMSDNSAYTGTYTWTSSDTSVATVSGNGATVTINALKEGATTITVTAGGQSVTCTVTVTDTSAPTATVTGITLNPTSLELTLDATGTASGTITATVTMSGSGSYYQGQLAIDTVAGLTITQTNNGDGTITLGVTASAAIAQTSVTVKAENESATFTITVKAYEAPEATVDSITLEPTSLNLTLPKSGSVSGTITATVKMSDDSTYGESLTISTVEGVTFTQTTADSDGKITITVTASAAVTETTVAVSAGGKDTSFNLTVNAYEPETPSHTHDYGDPVWTWNEDYTTCTVTWTCTTEGCEGDENVITKDATVTSSTTAATCVTSGETVYTATAKDLNDNDITDTKNVTISATGHTYGEPEWEWDEDYTSATAKFTCENSYCQDEDGQKTIEVKAEGNAIQQNVTTAATCGTAGSCTYTATVTVSFGEGTYTNTTEAVTIPATGEHEYSDIDENEITWSWSYDYSSCTASVTVSCKNCEATTTYETTCTVTEGTTVPSTCATPGYTEYTAAAVLNGQNFSNTVQATLALAAHTYPADSEENQTSGYITWDWTNKNDNTGTVQLTIKCTVCEEELFNQDVGYTVTKHADYNEYTATITTGGVTYTSTYTETADNHLVTDAEIWAELFPEGSEDDIEITLGANLTDSGGYEVSDPLWYVLYYDTDTRAVTIDLNGYTLDMSKVPDWYYVNGNDLTFRNGTLVLPDLSLNESSGYTQSQWYSWSHFTVTDGTLTFDGVTVEGAKGCVVYANGNSVINIINSTISTTGAYVVGTNASTSYSCEINITNSNLTASSVFNDGTAVLVNAPQTTVTITGSVLQGDVQGLVVRGGTAVVQKTSIVLSGSYVESDQDADNAYSGTYGASDEVAWGGGNNVPYAAIVVGNNSESYQYPTDVTFESVTVCTSGVNGVAWYLYVYSSSAACAVTISVDEDCNFAVRGFGLTYTNDDNSGPVYVGYSNDGVVVITGADVTVATVNTADSLLEALSGEGEISIIVTKDIEDDEDGALLKAFNKALAGEGTELTIELGSSDLTLGYGAATLYVGEGNSLTITGEKDDNGDNTAKLVTSNITGEDVKSYMATANICVEDGAKLTLINVDVETNSTAIYVQDGDVYVDGCDILSYGQYGICTNGLYSEGAKITIIESSVTMKKPVETTTRTTAFSPRTAVFVNVPCELTIESCKITSTFQGVVVRGGTASITNTEIIITDDFTGDTQSSTGYENYYFEGYGESDENSWGTANALPHAAIVIGNNGDEVYDAATDIVLDNVTIGLSSKNAWAVYAYSCSANVPVTVSVEGDCNFAIEGFGVTYDDATAKTLPSYCNFSNDGVVVISGTDTTVAAVNTAETLLEALSGEGEMNITVTDDIEDDDGALLNAFNSTLAGSGTELTIELGSSDLTFGTPGTYLEVGDGNSLEIIGETDEDGNNVSNLIMNNITGTSLKNYMATDNIRVDDGASLSIVNVDVKTCSTAIYVKEGEVYVEGCNIVANGQYGICTNGLYSSGAKITIINSTVTMERPEDEESTLWSPRVAVFVNVPCTLTIKGCVITSTFQGVIVRGGTATIKNTKIIITDDFTYDTQSNSGYENYYFDSYGAGDENSWGTGNVLPHAGIVIGNNGDSVYDRETSVTLDGVEFSISSDNAWAIYAYSCSENIPVTITITNCDFDIEYLGNHDLAEGLHAYCGVSDGGSITVGSETLEEKVEEDVPHEHIYTVSSFTWSSDYSSCEIVLICTNETGDCTERTITLQATDIEFLTVTEATCSDAGSGYYVATVEYDGETYSANSSEIEISALGHAYPNPVADGADAYIIWNWDSMNTGTCEVTVTIKCVNCGEELGTFSTTYFEDENVPGYYFAVVSEGDMGYTYTGYFAITEVSFIIPMSSDGENADTTTYAASGTIDDNSLFTLTAGEIGFGYKFKTGATFDDINGTTVNPDQVLITTSSVSKGNTKNIVSITAKADETVYLYMALSDSGYSSARTGTLSYSIDSGEAIQWGDEITTKDVVTISMTLSEGQKLTISASVASDAANASYVCFFGAEAKLLEDTTAEPTEPEDEANVVGVVLNETKVTLYYEDEIVVTAIVVMSDGSTYAGDYTWSLSEEEIVYLSGTGDSVSIRGLSEGKVTLTVKIGEFEASCDFTIKDPNAPQNTSFTVSFTFDSTSLLTEYSDEDIDDAYKISFIVNSLDISSKTAKYGDVTYSYGANIQPSSKYITIVIPDTVKNVSITIVAFDSNGERTLYLGQTLHSTDTENVIASDTSVKTDHTTLLMEDVEVDPGTYYIYSGEKSIYVCAVIISYEI